MKVNVDALLKMKKKMPPYVSLVHEGDEREAEEASLCLYTSVPLPCI